MTVPDTALHSVRLLNAPLLLWERSSQHTAELLREFNLLTIGLDHGGPAVPRRLLALVRDLQVRFAGSGEDQMVEREEALHEGRTSVDLSYQVPGEAADGLEALLVQLDDADDFCRSGALITLAAPEDQRQFREWYLGEFIRQIRGEPPTPWPGPLT